MTTGLGCDILHLNSFLGAAMVRETVVALLYSVAFVLMLFGAAVTLTGCAPMKYVVECSLIQPENCN